MPTYDRSDVSVGKHVRSARRQADQSQGDLSTALGLTRDEIADIEAGYRHVERDLLARIAAALQCGIADLQPTSGDSPGLTLAEIEQMHADEELELSSRDLYIPWGFNECEPPEWVGNWIHGFEYRYDVDADGVWKPVLSRFVHQYLLPPLAKHHTVELVEGEHSDVLFQTTTVDGLDSAAEEFNTNRLVTVTIHVPASLVFAELRPEIAAHLNSREESPE